MNQPETEYMPTLAEVTRYMMEWRNSVDALKWLKNVSLTCHVHSGTGVVFRALVWNGTRHDDYQGSSPEILLANLLDADAPAKRAQALRNSAEELLKRAAELEEAAV